MSIRPVHYCDYYLCQLLRNHLPVIIMMNNLPSYLCTYYYITIRQKKQNKKLKMAFSSLYKININSLQQANPCLWVDSITELCFHLFSTQENIFSFGLWNSSNHNQAYHLGYLWQVITSTSFIKKPHCKSFDS